MRPALLLAAALLGGCGAGEDAPDPGNAALQKSAGGKLHAGPTLPKADGVKASDLSPGGGMRP